MSNMENNQAPSNNVEGCDEWGHHAEVPEEETGYIPQNGQSADDLRQTANAYFANKDFDSALQMYTAALETFELEQGQKEALGKKNESEYVDLKVIYLCNRATCLYQMEMYEESRADALEAFNVSNGQNLKATFRLARAQLALKEFTIAIKTLEDAIKAENADVPSTSELNGIKKLLQIAHANQLQTKNLPNAVEVSKLKTLKTYIPNYKPSIREFKIIKELGEGNYSRVVAVQHVVTKEHFALKIIEKKKCEDLAKRQHPNVWNEIEMERKILGQRLWNDDGEDENGNKKYSWFKRIVYLFHTFKDYGNLYFLESIHVDGWDMWSTLRMRDKMVGTHESLVKVHLLELLEALEFIHARGVVHRDIKAENLLLSPYGHLILIDFGTAKDLIDTKCNGLEFVGTPDFMAPEAINGVSSEEAVEKMKQEGSGADHTLDLWCFGVLAYQLLTGLTPFQSPSQYLAYLRIQRGLLCRPMGITDDDAWDLISSLMKVDPKQRLGAKCYEYDTSQAGNFKMVQKYDGYSDIRQHAFFKHFSHPENVIPDDERVIPSLRDLCLRAVAELVEKDSTNLDIDKEHPQGCGSSHDMLRLNKRDRGCVMELLEKLRILSNPRVYRRFFKTKQEARLSKVRQSTRDYIGLTQMKDKQYQFPVDSSNENVDTERSDVLETVFPILYMHISNPLFIKEVNVQCSEEERKGYIAALKESLKTVNRTRPKLVVASGYLDDDCRKLLGKVNESIAVVLNDGQSFFATWSCGGQCLVLRTKDFVNVQNSVAQKCEQMEWLKEQLQLSEMTRHHSFAFVDCNPEELPKWLLKRLAKGRVLCMFGLSSGNESSSETEFVYSKPPTKDNVKVDDTDGDDNASQSSVDSATEEEDRHMKIIRRGDTSILSWKLEEYGAWEFENIL